MLMCDVHVHVQRNVQLVDASSHFTFAFGLQLVDMRRAQKMQGCPLGLQIHTSIHDIRTRF